MLFQFLLFLFPCFVFGQFVTVSIRSNYPEATMFVNGIASGNADGKTFLTLSEGTHQIKLVPPDSLSWTLLPIFRAVPIHKMEGRDTLFVEIPFPYTYRFTSAPFGAKVYSVGIMKQKIHLGTTPLDYTSFEQAEKFWAEDERLSTDTLFSTRSLFTTHHFKVKNDRVDAFSFQKPKKDGKALRILSGILSIGGGAYAAYHKLKADEIYYGSYTQTGNPLLKQQINQLDKKALGGLIVMQTGVLGLAIQWLKR